MKICPGQSILKDIAAIALFGISVKNENYDPVLPYKPLEPFKARLETCIQKSEQLLSQSVNEKTMENCSGPDGGLLIAENFYLRRKELDQQSLNYAARNKCLLKIRDRDTLIEQLL